jgi:hypothetical protein
MLGTSCALGLYRTHHLHTVPHKCLLPLITPPPLRIRKQPAHTPRSMLLPLTWAAGCTPRSRPDTLQRIHTLFQTLQPHYHLDQTTLERLIQVDWTQLTLTDLGDWEGMMKAGGYWLPLF